MDKYNKIYASAGIGGDVKPSQIINLIWKNFLPNCQVLDLGCGQGSDSLFLAKNNFLVTAVEGSVVAVKQIQSVKEELKLDNLEVIGGDVRDFVFLKDKYEVIICRNVLNFLDEDKALSIINGIKENIKSGGYIIVEVFTKNDPSFTSEHKLSCYFDEQELPKIFADYKIVYYFENTILDPGHPGFPAPHKHGVARIIAQK